MNTTGIAHIAICVNDLEQSLAFYRDILGMTVKQHATQAMAMRPGAGSSAMYDTPHRFRTVAYVTLTLQAFPAPFWSSRLILGMPSAGHRLNWTRLVWPPLLCGRRSPCRGGRVDRQGRTDSGDLADFRDAQGQMRTFFVYDPDHILVQFEQADAGEQP